MKMTLSKRYMLNTIEILDAMGFAKNLALEITGLNTDANRDIEARLPVSLLADLFLAAQDALGDPYIGLRSGYKFRIPNFGQTGNIYSYCRNIQQIIVATSKYQQLAISAGEIKYDQELDPQSGNIRHYMSFVPYEAEFSGYRHVIEAILGAYGTAYRWFSWSSGEKFLHVELPYKTPDNADLHNRVFRVPITYGKPYACFEFSERSLYHQLTTYDKDKFNRAEAKLTALLRDDDYNASLKVAVKMAMRDALREDKIGTYIVAEQMGKSWNVLRRQLLDANLSYRDLLESVRKEIFHESLADKRSFSEISHELGYNDQAAFTKAFKRWYGVSPRQWKAAYQIGQKMPLD